MTTKTMTATVLYLIPPDLSAEGGRAHLRATSSLLCSMERREAFLIIEASYLWRTTKETVTATTSA